MKQYLIFPVALFLFSGCASVAVTEDAITANTAHALGVSADDLTISNRMDQGIKTTYNAKTKSGRQYSCYVTGTVTHFGRTVSDAMCTELGRERKPGAAQAGSRKKQQQECNDLLRAAGRC